MFLSLVNISIPTRTGNTSTSGILPSANGERNIHGKEARAFCLPRGSQSENPRSHSLIQINHSHAGETAERASSRNRSPRRIEGASLAFVDAIAQLLRQGIRASSVKTYRASLHDPPPQVPSGMNSTSARAPRLIQSKRSRQTAKPSRS